jgi:hypothetical protein
MQSFLFLSAGSERIEFEVTASADGSAIVLDTRYNPPQEPDQTIHDDADQVAIAMADRVGRVGWPLTRIIWRKDEGPVGLVELARHFGVPILPD